MNGADDFEEQLRSLKPASPADDEASVLYACGYAAGRNSVLNEPASGTSWWKIAAAALLAGMLSGWGGYGMARRNVVEPQLAVAPPEIERPSNLPNERPADPQPQSIETIVAVASDRGSEPPASKRMLHWLPLPLDHFWNPSAAPAFSGDGNGVVLTARSGSAEWARWMEERPTEDRRRQNNTANDRERESSGEASHNSLTPMQWRHGDIDWEHWIH